MPDESTVPPIPYKIPVVDGRGFIIDAWAKWLRQVFTRIGGNIALSNVELEDILFADIETIQSDIVDLQTQDTSHTASIASHTTSISTLNTQVNDILQGPVL